jgi:hypothetical protein
LSTRPKKKQQIAAKRRFFVDSLIVIFIILSPFIFKLYEYVSDEAGATFNVLGIIIDDNGFQNLRVYVWFLLGKLVPLSLLVIWFFTCKHWWYHIILIPILMYAFQIFEEIYSDDKFIDTENVLWLLPVCIILIPFVYFIRIKLYDKYVHGIDLEAIDAELEALKSKDELSGVNDIPDENLDNLTKESIADELDRKLSTRNLEQAAKQFQIRLQNLVSFGSKQD